jgi:hypothetical protein
VATLDTNKPFSEVFGLTEGNHRFSQDGKFFDNDGVEIGAEPAVKKHTAKKPTPAAVDTSFDDII